MLPPGRYRLHAGAAAAPLGTLAVGTIKVHLQADAAGKDFSALHFPQNDEFVDLAVEFTLAARAKVAVQVDWRAGEESRKTKGLLGQRTLEIHRAAHGPGLEDKDLGPTPGPDDGLSLDREGGMVPLAEARLKPFHLLCTGIFIERLSPLWAEVQTDKLVYRPGEPCRVSVAFRNDGARAVQAAYVAQLAAGLGDPVRLSAGTIAIAAGETVTRRLADSVDTARLYWGGKVRVMAGVDGEPPAEDRAVFAVSSNIWETAIIAAGGHTAAYDDPARTAPWPASCAAGALPGSRPSSGAPATCSTSRPRRKSSSAVKPVTRAPSAARGTSLRPAMPRAFAARSMPTCGAAAARRPWN